MKRKNSRGKSTAERGESQALKVRLRGQDNAPLSIAQLREGLLEAARELQQYEGGYRAKFATLYLTLVDEDGTPVRVNEANELTIFPYRAAADDHGL